jgi:uncharacterized membrane protein
VGPDGSAALVLMVGLAAIVGLTLSFVLPLFISGSETMTVVRIALIGMTAAAALDVSTRCWSARNVTPASPGSTP